MVATDAIVEHAGATVTILDPARNLGHATSARTARRSCTSRTFLWPAIRRSRLIEAGGYDESFKVMQDWECFARLVLGGAVTRWCTSRCIAGG